MATVTITTLERCDRDGIKVDDGSYGRIVFDWTASASTTATLTWESSDGVSNSTTISLSGTSGTTAKVFGEDELNIELTYTVSVTVSGVSDSGVLSYYRFPFDVLSREVGVGVAIGKPAEKKDVFEVDLKTEINKTINIKQNRYAFSTPGVAGTAGYIKMATIRIVAANADSPITFVVSRRQSPTPMTLNVNLNNSAMTASSLTTFVYEGSNYDAYLHQSDTLVWDLYVLKGSNYDTITIQDWWMSKTMDARVEVTFPGELVSTVPTPYHKATPAKLRSLVDFIYPVNSIYISYSHVNPGTMFGGTWERITNAFLWGCDEDGGIGVTGGEKTHTLTTAEMPSHSHGAVYSGNATGTKNLPWLSTGTLGTGDKLAYSTIATGGGAAHNNMPPYVQVSIWRRTA
jgi:hypothetical protein